MRAMYLEEKRRIIAGTVSTKRLMSVAFSIIFWPFSGLMKAPMLSISKNAEPNATDPGHSELN